MELKPGYKQTDVGVIPEEWSAPPLKSLCVQGGLVRGPFGGSLKKEFFVNDGYKVYEQRNAIQQSVEIGSYYINQSRFRDLRRFEIWPSDFIVSCSGTIGRIFQIPRGAKEGIINQALLKIRTDGSAVLSQYFYYIFDWEQFQQRIIDNTQGGAMQNLVSMNVFRSILIPLPPPAEQRAIATALSDADALLAKLDALIAKKRNIKQAAMQQLLTGKQRLPGFSGEWEVKQLSSIAPLQRGFDLPTSQLRRGSYPVVYSNGVLNHHAECRAKGPGVVTGRSGTIGKVSYIESDYWPHNTTLWVTTFNGNVPKFVYLLYSWVGLARFATGSGVPTLNRSNVHAFSVAIPPTPTEQTAIATILSDMDAEIVALEARRDKTRALKQGMMQELLTGRIRLL